MLISKTAEVTWNAKVKKHYINAGYHYTRMGDKFTVDVSDLTAGSGVLVSVKCDYCNKEYKVEYRRYLNGRDGEIKKDCCDKCKKNKIRDVLLKKYGVSTPDQVEGAREKVKRTNIRLYGVENPFASDMIKEKIIQTNLAKYGCMFSSQSEIVQKKRRENCLKKYGVESHMKLDKYRKMFSGENSKFWKPDKNALDRERDRSCQEYRKWRDGVFQRDHYRCRCCGGRGDRKHGVQAHHILNYSSNPEVRFSLDNGITLCYQCHTKFHSIYGKKDNNLSQLIAFLNQGKKIC